MIRDAIRYSVIGERIFLGGSRLVESGPDSFLSLGIGAELVDISSVEESSTPYHPPTNYKKTGLAV